MIYTVTFNPAIDFSSSFYKNKAAAEMKSEAAFEGANLYEFKNKEEISSEQLRYRRISGRPV